MDILNTVNLESNSQIKIRLQNDIFLKIIKPENQNQTHNSKKDRAAGWWLCF